MNIATILFTYNRPDHTLAVLNGLSGNKIPPQKLYIFQDGMKKNTDFTEWKKVGEIISSVTWCNTEIHITKENKGLAASVADGVNYVMKNHDAVIVLEDDCVPHPLFMTYMVGALTKYKGMEKIYSISGSAWPVEVNSNGTDVYFTKRTNSCGWATWKERWAIYKQDYHILKRIKEDTYLSKQFHIWGENTENFLLGNITGKCDSWSVFWSLNVLERDGYCVAPYKSLIDNIGFDGSGTHSGTNKIEVEMFSETDRHEFVFADEIEISEETEINFSNYFAWTSGEERNLCYSDILRRWVQLYQKGKTVSEYFICNEIRNFSIWGRGKVCDLLLAEKRENIQIDCIIESKPKRGLYHGIPVVGVKDIPRETQLIVIIPVYDKKRIMEMLNRETTLRAVGIDEILEEAEKVDRI